MCAAGAEGAAGDIAGPFDPEAGHASAVGHALPEHGADVGAARAHCQHRQHGAAQLLQFTE